MGNPNIAGTTAFHNSITGNADNKLATTIMTPQPKALTNNFA